MNKVFDQFKLNEDLFYTIYDYLRFEKPSKWKDIHSVDDFDYLLVDEMKDLANDAVNWLNNQEVKVIVESSSDEKSTLYYMILAFMNSHNEYWGTPTYSQRNYENRKELAKLTVNWLRENINLIK